MFYLSQRYYPPIYRNTEQIVMMKRNLSLVLFFMCAVTSMEPDNRYIQLQNMINKNTDDDYMISLSNQHPRLNDTDLKMIADICVKNPDIRINGLDISLNLITEEGMKSVISILNQFSGSITKLDLSYNRIGDNGVINIVQYLKQSNSDDIFQFLFLSNNKITDIGFEYLVRTLGNKLSAYRMGFDIDIDLDYSHTGSNYRTTVEISLNQHGFQIRYNKGRLHYDEIEDILEFWDVQFYNNCIMNHTQRKTPMSRWVEIRFVGNSKVAEFGNCTDYTISDYNTTKKFPIRTSRMSYVINKYQSNAIGMNMKHLVQKKYNNTEFSLQKSKIPNTTINNPLRLKRKKEIWPNWEWPKPVTCGSSDCDYCEARMRIHQHHVSNPEEHEDLSCPNCNRNSADFQTFSTLKIIPKNFK